MKKQGFTLIELLAVILILGIIALIAVPTVSKVLDDSKQGSFTSTVNNLTKKVEENCSMELIKDKPLTYSYTIVNGEPSSPLEIKGDIPDGEITVDSNCNVTYELTNNLYNAVKSNPDEDVAVNKCKGNCLSYSEPILNGAKPTLDSGMIPITIENNGTVKKADIYSEWYSYEDKEWANIVLVTDDSRETYKEAEVGSTITSTDILGYFVWIPRYKYKISTGCTTTPSTIDIVFEDRNVEKSVGNATTEYYSHPGFTFGSKEVNGIWVAKFETTGTADMPTVLPNSSVLKNQIVNDQYNEVLKFNNYGITGGSHMMKNSEWGATSYLSHSKYGIKGPIRINNNNDYVTGCGGNGESTISVYECQIPYGSDVDELPQSTTNNITGVFDMSGGAHERIIVNFNDSLTRLDLSSIPSKYYDNYTTGDYSTACNGLKCLGHGTIETGYWYSNGYGNVSINYPLVDRGGSAASGAGAGMFYSGTNDGTPYYSTSFRVVIEP